jgi:hypothetical protein
VIVEVSQRHGKHALAQKGLQSVFDQARIQTVARNGQPDWECDVGTNFSAALATDGKALVT